MGKTSKFFFCLILFFSFLFINSPNSVFAEKVASFTSELRLEQNGDFFVSELISYDFEGLSRHGIFRKIPLAYEVGNDKYKIKIADISVADLNGQTQPFSTQETDAQVTIKIGDPDILITGQRLYKISYKVTGLVDYYDDHDEVYWNAVGAGWQVSLDKISVVFTPPAGIPVKDIIESCYVGKAGSKASCSYSIGTSETGAVTDISFFQERLNPNEALTVAIGLPKGILKVVPKERYKDALDVFNENKILWLGFYALLFFLPILISFIYYINHWWRFGRDARVPKPIITQYDPPAGLLPAEVGILVKGNINELVLPGKFIVAEIIYLATKGYLKITREKPHWYSFTNYILEQTNSNLDGLSGYQKIIIEKLFADGEKTSLKKLRKQNRNTSGESFYMAMISAMSKLKSNILQKNFFDAEANEKRRKGLMAGIFPSVFGGIALVWSLNNTNFVFAGAPIKILWWTGFSLVGGAVFISGFFISYIALLLDRRTVEGAKAKAHILGLKKYLTVAEKARLDFHNAPEKNPEEFERLLPYAIALGVEKKWAKQFESLSMPPRDWYSGTGTFSATAVSHDLGGFSSAFGGATGTGGGGGAGGDGGAGGGGGGGGGGSW